MINSSIKMPETIQKEYVPSLRFPKDEVLFGLDAIKNRKSDLDRALKLGNLDNVKTRIVFQDSENVKQVETTVWGVTDNRIILKQGIIIPIHRIHEVKF
jgi:uncharacterized protein (UPF0248 family)